MTPIRIQRKRVKGWKMPENTIYVGRGSRWGNPYKIDQSTPVERAILFFDKHITLMRERSIKQYNDYIEPLRGKNLACWCALDCECHADVLLRLVND